MTSVSDESDTDDESDPLFGGEFAFDDNCADSGSGDSTHSSDEDSSDTNQPTAPKKQKVKRARKSKPTTENGASYKVNALFVARSSCFAT